MADLIYLSFIVETLGLPIALTAAVATRGADKIAACLGLAADSTDASDMQPAVATPALMGMLRSRP